jgi:glycosyltransferase involved in cell wall biosynthesis
MRILHVVRTVNPEGGGPIEGVKQLSASALHAGHRVEICSLDSPWSPCIADFKLSLHSLGPAYGKYGYTKRLVPFLKQNSPHFDVVIVNGIWQYHSYGTWQTLRRASTPYVVFTHGMLDPWFKRAYPMKHLKKLLYWRWAEYRVLRDAAAVLFTTDDERVSARQSFSTYKANELVVNYGTKRPSPHCASQRSAFFDSFPALKGKRLCLFLGRIHPKKGCDLAIRAFAQTLAKSSDWHLVLAGPDQVGWQPALTKLAEQLNIAGRITFTGMLSGDLKWGAFHASEVFYLPSHQENFGIAVAEALACGLPVLISNKVNIWREVAQSNGGLVEPDNLAGAVALLSRWLNLPAADKFSMKENAAACFDSHFEIEAARRSLYSALESIVPKASPVHA